MEESLLVGGHDDCFGTFHHMLDIAEKWMSEGVPNIAEINEDFLMHPA